MRRLVALRLSLTLALAGLGAVVAAAAPPCTPDPLPVPTFVLSGAAETSSKPGDHVRRVSGTMESHREPGGGAHELVLKLADGKQLTATVTLPGSVALDVAPGAQLDLVHWLRQGFEGQAQGLAIRDGAGIVLLADDGGYGNAIVAEDRKPFTLVQKDAGCRDRENRPGDLNGFLLVASTPSGKVELKQGESGDLADGSRRYRVVAVHSSAKVGDAMWTDAPYEVMSYVIARVKDR